MTAASRGRARPSPAGATRGTRRVAAALVACLAAWLVACLGPAAAAGPVGAVATDTQQPTAGPAPGWTWPVTTTRVVRRFQPGLARWDPGHRGVDLAASPGAPVRAAAAGVVRFAGQVAGKPVVVVGHGALRTTYEPVRAEVSVGQQVAAGQLLGRLVAAHSHCLPAACLHLGLKRGDTYLDPLGVLRFRVRLLPFLRQP